MNKSRLDRHTGEDDSTSSQSNQFAGGKPYQWPPQVDPNLEYKPKTRNPVHSIITALPLIMLVAGLYIYYRGESKQAAQSPIFAQSIDMAGTFTGLSATQGQHYLWIDVAGVAKGIRVQPEQSQLLEDLERDAPVSIKVAPSVSESKTHWAWYVEQANRVFLDAEDTLR